MKLLKKVRKTLQKQLKQLTKYATKRSRKLRRHKHSRKIYFVAALLLTGVAGLLGWYLYVLNSTSQTERLITFHDRGMNYVILTNAITVRAALRDARITVAPQDIVEPAIDSPFQSTDSAVIIYRSRPILVIDGAFKQKIVTPAASPNEITTAIGLPALDADDKAHIAEGNIVADGASQILTIERSIPPDPVAQNNFDRKTEYQHT